MFKKLGWLVLAACLMVPAQSFAASDQMGIYIAPKFIVGIGQFKMKHSSTSDGGNETINFGNHSPASVGGALAIGYDFYKKYEFPMRAELEYSLMGQMSGTKDHHWDDVDGSKYKGKINVQSLFLNAYYDFHNSTKFTPYVGVGVGFGFVGMKQSVTDYDILNPANSDGYTVGKKTRTNFAWNVGLGCAYNFTDNIAVDLGYRYASFGKASTKTYEGTDWTETLKASNVGMHQFMLSARITF